MDTDGFAGSAETGESLIDEQRTVVVVKGTLATDKQLDALEPRWVIDESLKGLTCLIDLLVIEAILRAICVPVDVTEPLTGLQPWHAVEGAVAIGDLRGR